MTCITVLFSLIHMNIPSLVPTSTRPDCSNLNI
jgi:hypothetical protein